MHESLCGALPGLPLSWWYILPPDIAGLSTSSSSEAHHLRPKGSPFPLLYRKKLRLRVGCDLHPRNRDQEFHGQTTAGEPACSYLPARSFLEMHASLLLISHAHLKQKGSCQTFPGWHLDMEMPITAKGEKESLG